MNEELMKELLEILRSMRTGTPAVWQELLTQRSFYCWMNAAMCLGLGLLFAVSMTLLWKRQTRNLTQPFADWDEDTKIATLLPAILFGIGVVICVSIGLFWIPDAVAPLGGLLGKLK